MKSIRITFTVTLFFAMVAGFLGCKGTVDPVAACRIITITPSPTGDVMNLSYNSLGKLTRVTYGATLVTYDYSNDTLIVTSTQGGVFQNRAIVKVNSLGLATNVRTEVTETGTQWTNVKYEYNGEELSKSTSTNSMDNDTTIITYSWLNQNLVTMALGPLSTTLDYYADKFRQTGDYLAITQLLQGYEIYRTKNLLKTYDGTSVNYQFGEGGRISSLSATSAIDTSKKEYKYECSL